MIDGAAAAAVGAHYSKLHCAVVCRRSKCQQTLLHASNTYTPPVHLSLLYNYRNA
jgi:hypothetical protein